MIKYIYVAYDKEEINVNGAKFGVQEVELNE